MPSPFPGMDPYLEDPAVRMDFHERFLTYLSDALNEALPDLYDARIEERISLVRFDDTETELFRADIGVSKQPAAVAGRPEARPTGVVTLEPVTVPLVIYDEIHESYVQILRRSDRKLITVIELLSPTNKSGDGKHQYYAKRNSLLATRVHLVEIDLLVNGERPPFEKPIPNNHYCALVSRGDRRPDCQVFTWSVRDALPAIPIPLETPDPDLVLDLAALFRTAYDRGRYERTLRYLRQPPPMFDRESSLWAEEQAKRARA